MQLQRIRELEEKMTKLQAWENEKQRYKLTDLGGETFVYELIPEQAHGDPPHRICAKCFHDGRKSILHFLFRSRDDGAEWYECHACKERRSFGGRR
jgi:hypothetical protein